MHKLYYQKLGEVMAIAIQSTDPEEILHKYWSFLNRNATSGELTHLSAELAYFFTTEKKLKKYFKDLYLLKWDPERVITEPINKLAQKYAEEEMAKLEYLSLVKYGQRGGEEYIFHANMDSFDNVVEQQRQGVDI